MWILRIGKRMAAGLAVMAVALPAVAQQGDAASLREAQATGQALWRLDVAIVAARHSAEQRRNFRKAEAAPTWLHEREDQDTLITFVQERDGTPMPRFHTRVDASGTASSTEKVDDPLPLQGADAARYAAQITARQVAPTACSRSFDDILIPASNGNLIVYRIQRAAYNDVVMAGGNQRIELTPDGTRVLASRDLTGDCTALQKTTGTVGIVEPFDPQPNELHVWLAYALGKPLFVTTKASNLLWLVRDGKIEPMGPAG